MSETAMISKQRDGSIDLLRGGAVLLVVLGHCIQYGSGDLFFENKMYFENWLFRFIYSFHMPLFALISGYLFFWSMRRSSVDLLKKQICSLVVPIVVWKGLEVIVLGVTQIIQSTFNLGEMIHSYIVSLPYAFWFLWAMFGCSMIVLVVERVLRGKWWIYPLILVVMLFVPTKLNSQMYAYMMPYFVVGYLFHKKPAFDIEGWTTRKYLFVTCACAAVFIALFFFYDNDSFIYTTRISLLEADNAVVQLGIDVYRWIIGFAGSFMFILIGKMIYEHFSKSVIIKGCVILGQISLGIYILNSYTNVYILQPITGGLSPNILIWILEMAISLIAYYVVIYVIQKISIANKLLLGGRTH